MDSTNDLVRRVVNNPVVETTTHALTIFNVARLGWKLGEKAVDLGDRAWQGLKSQLRAPDNRYPQEFISAFNR